MGLMPWQHVIRARGVVWGRWTAVVLASERPVREPWVHVAAASLAVSSPIHPALQLLTTPPIELPEGPLRRWAMDLQALGPPPPSATAHWPCPRVPGVQLSLCGGTHGCDWSCPSPSALQAHEPRCWLGRGAAQCAPGQMSMAA